MNDLKCPYCPREFSNRHNRDEHAEACYKRHKSSHGQQRIGKFFSFAPPVQAAAPLQEAAHAEPAHAEPAPAAVASPEAASAHAEPMEVEKVQGE